MIALNIGRMNSIVSISITFALTIYPSLLITGCASGNNNAYDPARLSKIKRGITTKEEVEHLLGKPTGMQTINGNDIWIYHSNDLLSKGHKRTGLAAAGTVVQLVPVIGPYIGMGATAGSVGATLSPQSATYKTTKVYFDSQGIVLNIVSGQQKYQIQ